ncbi:MAG: glucose-1-phosphate adenylyltransferase [Planctomycetota bacterium]|nr:glucose-1-phosphate adenylyltransferase [Planctomycetota bacterium]
MENTIAVILGGGQGTRLFPLTRDRAKPAVPLAGKYRLIDIPVSNCINSGVRRIFVLTMFQSASLNNHIASAYRFDAFSRGFVQVLAAEQTLTGGTWFQGTADAVRQSWVHMSDVSAERILILSGDHIYCMDYAAFLEVHTRCNADFVIAAMPVTRAEAPQLGLLQTDASGRIIRFREKPKTEEELREMEVDTTRFGLSAEEAKRRPFLASMGIYLFDAKTLHDLLMRDPAHTDFGKHIIPSAIGSHKAYAYCFDGYWADVGTIPAFYDANMDLVKPLPRFNLFNPLWPIYTNSRFLPGAKVNRASVESSILCEGVIVEGGMVRDSILGVRARVRPGATIDSSIVMGADFYQPGPKPGEPPPPFMGIGEGAYIKTAIIDKNACIGRGAQLVNARNLESYDDPEGRFYVRDRIIVVPKGAVIPDGFMF